MRKKDGTVRPNETARECLGEGWGLGEKVCVCGRGSVKCYSFTKFFFFRGKRKSTPSTVKSP